MSAATRYVRPPARAVEFPDRGLARNVRDESDKGFEIPSSNSSPYHPPINSDDGTPGNVSAPVTVGFGGWLQFKFLFAGRSAVGEDRIYAVNQDGELLSYGDSGEPGNVSDPVTVGFGAWRHFKFLFCGRNAAGEDRIYAVNQNKELLSYGDSGDLGNVSDPVKVGFGGWLQFKFLFGGRNLGGQDRIYAVVS